MVGNLPAQAESWLLRVEQAAEGISFYLKYNKIWLHAFYARRSQLHFKWQITEISIKYLGTNIKSTESDVSIFLRNEWITIGKL